MILKHFNAYFFYGDKVGNTWFIGRRGRGTSENGLKVERVGWKFKFTRLNPTYKKPVMVSNPTHIGCSRDCTCGDGNG